jgi:hypothetical protein
MERRDFLKLAVISGLAAGCTSQVVTTTPVVTPGTATYGSFRLENDTVQYGAHPRGCDVTTIRGKVTGADGQPIDGLHIKLWLDDPAQATTLATADGGLYALDVAQGLVRQTFHLQLLDAAGQTTLSEVIVAEAVPDCNLNNLTLNFIETP